MKWLGIIKVLYPHEVSQIHRGLGKDMKWAFTTAVRLIHEVSSLHKGGNRA